MLLRDGASHDVGTEAAIDVLFVAKHFDRVPLVRGRHEEIRLDRRIVADGEAHSVARDREPAYRGRDGGVGGNARGPPLLLRRLLAGDLSNQVHVARQDRPHHFVLLVAFKGLRLIQHIDARASISPRMRPIENDVVPCDVVLHHSTAHADQLRVRRLAAALLPGLEHDRRRFVDTSRAAAMRGQLGFDRGRAHVVEIDAAIRAKRPDRIDVGQFEVGVSRRAPNVVESRSGRDLDDARHGVDQGSVQAYATAVATRGLLPETPF